MALRHNHDDEYSGEKSFRFGSSTTNTVSGIIMFSSSLYMFQKYYVVPVQRIEGWWSQLRKSVTDWWINLFKVHV